MSRFWRTAYMTNDRPGSPPRREEKEFFLPDQGSVRLAVEQSGGRVISIRERRLRWWDGEIFTKSYRLRFLRTLGFFITSNSPGVALVRVIETEADMRKRAHLNSAVEVINRGGDFTQAVRSIKLFDRSVIAILEAGERVGRLKDAIAAATGHVEKRGKSLKMVMSAMAWFWIDVISTVATVFEVHFHALPWIRENAFDGVATAKKAEILAALDRAEAINLGFMGIVGAVGILAVAVLWSTFLGRGRDDSGKRSMMSLIPGLGTMIVSAGIAETFSIVSRMVSGSAPFAEAVRAAEKATIVGSVSGFWKRVGEMIGNGWGIDKAMARDPLSHAERMEISGHRNLAQLVDVLASIAESREQTAERYLKMISSLSILGVLLFGAGVTLNVLYVVWVQNEGFTSSMQSIMGG